MIGDIGVASRCAGVPVHDCWASNFARGRCARAPCWAYLLRELAFTVESSGFRPAHLMEPLLRETCRAVNANDGRALAEAEFHALRRRCRTILAQGVRQLPATPPPTGCETGRTQPARTLRKAEGSPQALCARFGCRLHEQRNRPSDPDGEGQDRGCGRFRTWAGAEARRRISGCLDSVKDFRTALLAAIRLALAGRAADMVGPCDGPTTPSGGEQSIRHVSRNQLIESGSNFIANGIFQHLKGLEVRLAASNLADLVVAKIAWERASFRFDDKINALTFIRIN